MSSNNEEVNLRNFLIKQLSEIKPNTNVKISRFFDVLIEEGIENYLYEDFQTIEDTGRILGEIISSHRSLAFDKFNQIISRNNLEDEFDLEEIETTFFFSDAKSEEDFINELKKSH